MGTVDGWAVDPWIQLRVLGCQVGSKSVCWTFQAWMRGTRSNVQNEGPARFDR